MGIRFKEVNSRNYDIIGNLPHIRDNVKIGELRFMKGLNLKKSWALCLNRLIGFDASELRRALKKIEELNKTKYILVKQDNEEIKIRDEAMGMDLYECDGDYYNQ